MKPALTRIKRGEVFHFVDGNKIAGLHDSLSGDVSGLSGNVDDCDITDEERKNGVDIECLVLGKEVAA